LVELIEIDENLEKSWKTLKDLSKFKRDEVVDI
jgi:hypothetical protein